MIWLIFVSVIAIGWLAILTIVMINYSRRLGASLKRSAPKTPEGRRRLPDPGIPERRPYKPDTYM